MKAELPQSTHRRMPVRSRRQARSPAVAVERALPCLNSAESWPEIGQWAERELTLATIARNRLGVDPRIDDLIGASRILKALGPDSFAEFSAVRVPGRIIWFNFDLAKQLGFDVPSENRLTTEFHNLLVTMLSLNVAGPLNGSQPDHETVTMFADKYGGDGVRPALGAGRAGFLPFGNLYIKGVGFTPLFKHNDPDDFVHSHGAVHLEDCLSEAVFGEVNENLFTHGSTRVLAIIDQGKHVKAPNGRRIPVALLVRAGLQLRPAHLLGTDKDDSLVEKFVRVVRSTGQLVMRHDVLSGNQAPDVKATMLRIIEDHARTSAEGFRWRMIHGALSSSNMEMSGAMLDLPTQSAQSRTAPIWSLESADSAYGTEHLERALRLASLNNALLRKTPRSLRVLFTIRRINVVDQMEKAYSRQLQVQLLRAAGLKTEVAQRMQTERTELATRFTELVLQMAALKNAGTACASKSATDFVSVLDVFNLLKSFPATYFANPDADHRRTILDLLLPVFRGNRFHSSRMHATAQIFISNFADLYTLVMNASREYAKEFYGDFECMEASIVARANFENVHLDALYSRKLYQELGKTIAGYKATKNAEIIRRAIDQRIVASLRDVDALLAQGNSRRLAGGGIELEMRTIDGINYSVLAWNDKNQTRRVRIRIPIKREGLQYVSAVPGLGFLTKRSIHSLRYRYTTDGWNTSAEVSARLRCDVIDGLIIDFDELNSLPLIGRLEGTFCDGNARTFSPGDGTTIWNGYVFALPDRHELLRIAAIPSGVSRLQ